MDISYFQRSLILAKIHSQKDSSESIHDRPPVARNKKYGYVPALFELDGPHTDAPHLTIALNILESMKSLDFDIPEPFVPPLLPSHLIALTADKGGNTVIIPKDFYFKTLQADLDSNPSVYKFISASNAKNDFYIAEKIFKSFTNSSPRWNLHPEELKFICYPSRNKIPKLRGSPKIHKLGSDMDFSQLKFRPIMSGKNGPLSSLSQVLDKFLRPLAEIMPCRIQDSFDAINFLNRVDWSTKFVHTFDAVSLYTSFDVDLCLKAINFWVNHDYGRLIPPEICTGTFLQDAITTLFTKNYFSFNGNLYCQQNGIAMGTESAVSLAEIILGYLEYTLDFDPLSWGRYIDDGICILPLENGTEQKNLLLKKLNSASEGIKWTSDTISNPAVFLDLKIDQSSGCVSTFHKPTSGLSNFVPWDSDHFKHQKLNICFNLFYRAIRINSNKNLLESELNRIELGLMIIGYPYKVLQTQKRKALSHCKIKLPLTFFDNNVKEKIFFTTTRNPFSLDRRVCMLFTQVVQNLSLSKYFKDKVIKRSFRQPPSVKTLMIWNSLSFPNQGPVPCGQNACKTCNKLYRGTKWTSNCGFLVKVARATCCTRDVIYILVDSLSNEVEYVGQTKQRLNQRIGQNRRGSSWHRTSDYFIIPVQAPLESVKKIELEAFYIHKLKPRRNKQVQYYWWSARSHFDQSTDTNTTTPNNLQNTF